MSPIETTLHTENVLSTAKRMRISCLSTEDTTDLVLPNIAEYSTNNEMSLDINVHRLEISSSPIKAYEEHSIVGRRILDFAYICTQIREKDNHEPYSCSFKDICTVETKIGLTSSFSFKCNFCLKQYALNSENTNANMTDINIAAVAGIMNVGGGFSQLQTISASLEVPPLSQHIYNKSHDIVCKSYEESAVKNMEAATKEEIQLAISAGEIDTDGTPVISVVADGS